MSSKTKKISIKQTENVEKKNADYQQTSETYYTSSNVSVMEKIGYSFLEFGVICLGAGFGIIGTKCLTDGLGIAQKKIITSIRNKKNGK